MECLIDSWRNVSLFTRYLRTSVGGLGIYFPVFHLSRLSAMALSSSAVGNFAAYPWHCLVYRESFYWPPLSVTRSLMLRYCLFGSKFFVATGLTWFVGLWAEASVCSHYVCSLGYRSAQSSSTDRCSYAYPQGSAWRPGRSSPWRKSAWCVLISVGRTAGLDAVGRYKVFLRWVLIY
jgi:hypothetical protein